ncbi:peroxisome assembly factor 2 [Tetranychus urticae]|uniref:Peroxisomal ATPase PEX6 n=1 Tax=Tetranychus urticae TaxID=32264 RepID=T1KUA5_TETUR|nr:peroxisome assembly factor 2 [Tetranychus urticae]
MFSNEITCIFKVLEKQIVYSGDCDSDNGCVFFSLASLEKFHLHTNDWVNLKLVDNVVHLATVVSVENDLDDDCAYISPILYFNLIGRDKHVDSVSMSASTQLTIFPVADIEVANEINLSLVTSPDYPHLSDLFHLYENLVHDYFSKQRILKQNDILAISSLDNPDFYRLYDDPVSIHWPVIYFSVQKIDGTAKHCVKTRPQKTQIYIFGIVHSPIPYAANLYFSDKPNLPIPERYCDKLTKLVHPYLYQLKRRIGAILVSGPTGCGKLLTTRKVASRLNLNLFVLECYDLLADTSVATAKAFETQLSKIKSYAPCIVFLRSIDLLCLDKEDVRVEDVMKNFLVSCQRDRPNGEHGIILIASTSKPVNDTLNKFGFLFTVNNHLSIETLKETERRDIIQIFLKDNDRLDDVTRREIIDTMAAQTNGFLYGDLMTVCIKLNNLDEVKMKEICPAVIKEHSRKYARSLGAPTIPNVSWSDIGGLEEAKKEVIDCIQRPTDYPQLQQRGLRRCGFLLYGPPGTGKTLLAKAVASQFSYNFLSVKGPELISAYVGQSEENIRNIFQRAIKARPSIVFFDELDSLAPKRGKFGDSGGVMDRIVSQLACEMDIIANYPNIFVFGATNRPDLLDSGLLRPGRFERWVYVGPPCSLEERISVLSALTHRFNLADGLELTTIEERLPQYLTGADFYSICSSAMMTALQRVVKEIENGEKDERTAQIDINQDDFDTALKYFTPSVKKEELENYQAIRARMERD